MYQKQFKWYEEITNSSIITQGDILESCNIPVPNESLYESIANDGSFESDIDLKIASIIILSQACDIANQKVDSIVVCPIWSLAVLIKGNEYYKASAAKESLRQGKEPAYHLLNEYTGDDFNFPFSVVDFHRIYTLPKKYLEKFAESKKRLRLLPPYREHLSQAFARYFMRVGLPLDIPSDSIKKIS